tara:strand:- start:19035 stop:19805 length:771 start_codon:yes stop_codon:yes gene_type:complete
VSHRQHFYHWRVLAKVIGFVLFGLGGLLLGYVLFPLVSLLSPDRRLAKMRCRRLVQLSFRFFIGLLSKAGVLTFHISGAEELDRRGNIVIANHPTLIDIVFLISMIPNATCIVKPSLFNNVFTRGPVSWAGYIPSNEADTLIADSEAQLADNATLVIFPEGSRSVPNQPLKFKRGAAYLWLRTQCALSLVAITVDPPFLTKHEKWYQVPYRRPHFQLVVKEGGGATDAQTNAGTRSTDTRTLTRQWQDHFTTEIVI